MISDNFVGGDDPSTIPAISLPSLRHLSIDCATEWYFRTKGNAFDLFSLLGRIHSPELRSVILYGSFHQLIAAVGMVNDEVHPHSLTLSFLSMEDANPPMTLHQAPILTQLQQLTLDCFDPKWSSIYWKPQMLKRLYPHLQMLVGLISEGCDMEFRGGNELLLLTQLDMPSIQALDLFYRAGEYNRHKLAWPATNTWFRSLTVSAGSASHIYAPWFRTAQRVIINAVDLDILLMRISAYGAFMSALDVGNSTMDSHRVPDLPSLDFTPVRHFSYLRRLRMTAEMLKAFIENFTMPVLQEITFSKDESGDIGPFEALLNAIFKRGDLLPQLCILHLEAFPPWEPLTRFVASFNKPLREGISTVILPGLPNPSRLRPLVEALKNTSENYMAALHYNDVPATPGCDACVGDGWIYYEGADCRKFSSDTVVSVTKETYVGKYSLD